MYHRALEGLPFQDRLRDELLAVVALKNAARAIPPAGGEQPGRMTTARASCLGKQSPGQDGTAKFAGLYIDGTGSAALRSGTSPFTLAALA